jgi:Helicase associated domain
LAALDALGFSWDLLQQDFDRGLSELERYVEENGNARVQAAYKTSAGFALGTWRTVRREQRKEGRLSAERVAALDALGFFWEPLQQSFDAGLAELAAYVEEAGDARVPTKHVTATGFKLGAWCSVRRQQRREGRLSAERMAAMDALSFVWDPLQREFDHGLAELAEYVAKNGNARVPIKHLTATGFKLGMW